MGIMLEDRKDGTVRWRNGLRVSGVCQLPLPSYFRIFSSAIFRLRVFR